MSPFFSRPSRRFNRRNVIDGASQIIKILNEATSNTHLTPLKSVCGVALVILDIIQTHQKLKEDYEYLGLRAAEFAAAVFRELELHKQGNLSDETQQRISKLLLTLECIQNFIVRRSQLKLLDRIIKMQQLKEEQIELEIQLGHCIQMFNLTTILDNNVGIKRAATTILEETNVANVGIQQILGGVSDCNSTLRVIGDRLNAIEVTTTIDLYDQIQLGQTVDDTLQNGYLAKAKVASRSTGSTMRVVVKSYRAQTSKQIFQREVKIWKGTHQPNICRLLKYSPCEDGSKGAFVIFSDYKLKDVHTYQKVALTKGDVDSIMITTRMMQGLTSGLYFLSRERPLTKNELIACFDTSKAVIGDNDNIVIGYNLEISDVKESERMLLDRHDPWMKNELWYTIAKFVYGKDFAPDMSDWQWTCGRKGDIPTSHLRLLQTFADHTQPSFADIAAQLTEFLCRLTDYAELKMLTLPNIRRAILDVKKGRAAFPYRPKKPFPVSLLDIGYIRNEKFVKLGNCRKDLQFDFFEQEPLSLTCSGTVEVGIPDGTGRIRYKFSNVSCAGIRRLDFREGIKDTGIAWNFIIDHFPLLHQRYKLDHPDLKLSEMFLVTRVENGLRYMNLNWRPINDSESDPPERIDFLEYENPDDNGLWGYWELVDKNGFRSVIQNDEQFRIENHHCVQSLSLIQLEDSDALD